jgi:hypothetical protein
MTCYECHGRPGPGGMSYDEKSAVGVCRRCGRGACKTHSVWAEATHELLCTDCASRFNGPRT